tara:strand:- start:2110 stop:2850 length:741 start_codon:yes stop_codon:yes gene_type:complete
MEGKMIDTVYQTVLALANKEQRGYITPQEFNLFAKHAQMDIFEQYFYDLNQFKRIPGNQSDYADVTGIIEEKIQRFVEVHEVTQSETGVTLPDNVYRLSVVTKDGRTCELMSRTRANLALGNKLTRATKERPICYRLGQNQLEIRPIGVLSANTTYESVTSVVGGEVRVSYIRKPKAPNWTYQMILNKPMWNDSETAGTQDFELHPSEEQNLIIKILKLSGVSIKDPVLAQVAVQEEVNNIKQEKA